MPENDFSGVQIQKFQRYWTAIETYEALKASDQLLQDILNMDEAAVAKELDTVDMENTSILSYNNKLSLPQFIKKVRLKPNVT